MQLASFLNKDTAIKTRQRTLQQKTRQIFLAREIEKRWSKNEILEAYLNLVTFRGEYAGIAAASRGLFGKNPHGLDQLESLILASLIRAPNAGAKALESQSAASESAPAMDRPGFRLRTTKFRKFTWGLITYSRAPIWRRIRQGCF